MPGAVAFIGGVVGAAATSAISIVAGLASAIGAVVGSVVGTITELAGGITDALGLTFKAAELPLDVQVSHIISTLTGPISAVANALAAPLKPLLEPVRQGLLAINETFKALNAGVDAALGPMTELRELIITVSSFKILSDLLTGVGGLYTITSGSLDDLFAEYRNNIFTLAKATVELGVNMVDKIDTEVRLLGVAMDAADERMQHTIKTDIALLGTVITENDERLRTTLGEEIALAKAIVMGKVTPRMDTLGTTQLAAIRAIARLSRHIEDEAWFGAMLLRLLR